MISLRSYLSFVFWMVVGFGLFFQLPLAVVAISRAGIINPWKLKLYRKHVILAIVVAAAVLTPGPDVISQMGPRSDIDTVKKLKASVLT